MRVVILTATMDFKCEVIDFDVKHVRCVNKGIPAWRYVKTGEKNLFLPCGVCWSYADVCLDFWIFVRGDLQLGCGYFPCLGGILFYVCWYWRSTFNQLQPWCQCWQRKFNWLVCIFILRLACRSEVAGAAVDLAKGGGGSTDIFIFQHY